jgi:two-component system sensor histidine kinase KdpD
VVRLRGKDPVAAIIDFARGHDVGHIVIGRSHQSWWRQVLGRSVPLRLMREAAGFDLHVISFEDDEGT